MLRQVRRYSVYPKQIYLYHNTNYVCMYKNITKILTYNCAPEIKNEYRMEIYYYNGEKLKLSNNLNTFELPILDTEREHLYTIKTNENDLWKVKLLFSKIICNTDFTGIAIWDC